MPRSLKIATAAGDKASEINMRGANGLLLIYLRYISAELPPPPGETINTPSLMCVEDYIDALNWGKSLGGLEALIARADANSKALGDWVARAPWVDFLAADPRIRSNTSVCLKVVDPAVAALAPAAQAAFAKALENLLEKEKVAFDIGAYREAPPGLRIWCGATIETSDIEALTPWLDFAFAKTKGDLAKAA